MQHMNDKNFYAVVHLFVYTFFWNNISVDTKLIFVYNIFFFRYRLLYSLPMQVGLGVFDPQEPRHDVGLRGGVPLQGLWVRPGLRRAQQGQEPWQPQEFFPSTNFPAPAIMCHIIDWSFHSGFGESFGGQWTTKVIAVTQIQENSSLHIYIILDMTKCWCSI